VPHGLDLGRWDAGHDVGQERGLEGPRRGHHQHVRLQAADAYDHLAGQIVQATEASATRQHAPGHAAAAPEAGQ
jgi:hypothetical protein